MPSIMFKNFLFCSELPMAPVINDNRVEKYDDTSLKAKLDGLQKQFEDLKKQLVRFSLSFRGWA